MPDGLKNHWPANYYSRICRIEGDFLSAFAGEGTEKTDLSELLRRLDRQDFDLVAVGRAILSDYQWVQKIKNGNTEELSDFSAESLKVLY